MVKNGGYTELISEGEGITIEKGKISVTGGSGGGGGGVKIVREIGTTLDSTYTEIKNAFLSGMQVILVQENEEAILYFAIVEISEAIAGVLYEVSFGDSFIYTTTTADGYPAHDFG